MTTRRGPLQVSPQVSALRSQGPCRRFPGTILARRTPMDIVESSRSPEEEGDTLPRSSSSVCTMLGSLAAAVCGTGGDEPESATEKLLSPPSRQCYTASVRPGAFGLSMRLSDRLVVEHVPGPSRPSQCLQLLSLAPLTYWRTRAQPGSRPEPALRSDTSCSNATAIPAPGSHRRRSRRSSADSLLRHQSTSC